MLLSMQTDNLWNFFSIEEVLTMIKNCGFDAYDFTMFDLPKESFQFNGDDYVEKAKEVRRVADSLGLVCNQTHSPYPHASQKVDSYDEKSLFYIIRAIEISSILGAPITVVHPYNVWSAEKNKYGLYDKLLPYAKKFNVKIATENMWNWDDEESKILPAACSCPETFNKMLDILDKDWFTACVDIGHAEMFGDITNAPALIRGVGSRIKAIHVHDNDKISDLHSFPFNGVIDWEEVCKALRDVNYSGDLTFETYSFVRNCPKEIKPQALELLGKIGRYLINKIQGNI